MKLTFFGAAKTVTGSKHLLETPNGFRLLLDCGLFQGKSETDPNRQFGFDPRTIDSVVLSHAHIDHCGLLPRLVKEGFQGKIYCTPPTLALVEIMLEDSARIQENDIEYVNKKRAKKGQKPLKVLYDLDDVKNTLSKLAAIDYHQNFQINDELSLYFTDAGHIIGSACVNITYKSENQKLQICYTGDVGRFNDKILRSPETIPNPDVLICESTYGAKTHRPQQDEILHDIVHETCVLNKGKLIIPAFSVDRTQEIIYALDRLKTEGRLPKIPVFVDSPLSVKTTHVMRMYSKYFNTDIQDYMSQTDGDAFHFDNLYYITNREDSMKLNESTGPCIIISASGMAEAGPVKHHIKHAIQSPKNTILFSGHCTPESLGGKLIAGAQEVVIYGDVFHVKSKIDKIEGYSAHADKNELLQFLSPIDKRKLKTIFLVHGEEIAAFSLANLLKENQFQSIIIPNQKQSFDLL